MATAAPTRRAPGSGIRLDAPRLRARMRALGLADPSQASDPTLRDLYEFWLSRRDRHGRFHFARFDVTELPRHLLPQLYLIKVEPGTRRFAVRIAGQRVIDLSGTNAGGRYIDEIPGADRSQARMEFCLDTGLPYMATDALTWGAYDYKSYSVCVLPLHDDVGQIAYFLAAVCVHGMDEPVTRNAHAALRSSNLPRVESRLHEAAFECWLGARAGRPMPRSADIDLLARPEFSPYLVLVEVLRDPLDFRYRAIGALVRSHLEPRLLGHSMREPAGPGPESGLWRSFETVVETGIPRYGRTPYTGSERDVECVADLLLPLSGDGDTVSQILLVADFQRTDETPRAADEGAGC